MPLFKKIIDDAVPLAPITQVAFAGLAEPLIDPMIVERIAYTKQSRPDWRLEMYTNGVFLTPDKFEALKSAGLDIIVISLNAANAEQHERIMGLKGKYGLVCANADYAIEHRGSMYLDVRAVADGETFAVEDARVFLKRWGSIILGGHGKLIGEMNWANQLYRTISPFDPNSCCKRALEQFSIHHDGRVNLCCLDPMSKYSWGDMKTQTIREVYNQAGYVEFREWHRDNQAAKHELCRICTRV